MGSLLLKLKGNNSEEQKEENLTIANYFSSVNELLLRNYVDLHECKMNKIIMLQKKFFDKVIPLRMNIDLNNIPEEDKNWKKHILSHFNREVQEGMDWYNRIIYNIENEPFLGESRYQSLMFFKDLEIMHKQNLFSFGDNKFGYNLNNIDETSEEDEIEKEKELKVRLSRNSILAEGVCPNDSKYSKISLLGIGGGDFKGDEEEDFDDEENQGRESTAVRMKSKKYIKEYMKIIKKHIKKIDHPINIITKFFENQISKVIEFEISELKKLKESNNNQFSTECDEACEDIVDHIQKFLLKIQTTLKIFYSGSIHMDCFTEEKDEVLNALTSLLFNTGDIYYKIYEIFSIKEEQNLFDFSQKLAALENIKPKDLNIHDRLCLDENTQKDMKRLKQDYEDGLKGRKYIYGNERSTISGFLKPYDGILKDFHSKNQFNGYNTVIKFLHNLKNIRAPYEKMMLVASMTTELTQCVDRYWSDMEEYLPSDYLRVNADELLSLFVYIIIQSKVPDLIVHEKIIKEFTCRISKSSIVGFYNTTLSAAISYIKDDILKELKIGITQEFRESAMRTLRSISIKDNKQNENINTNLDVGDELVLVDHKGLPISNTEEKGFIKTNTFNNNNTNRFKGIFNSLKNSKSNSNKNLLETVNEINDFNCEMVLNNQTNILDQEYNDDAGQ